MNSAFKILTHKMFLDTTFNSVDTVLSTIYQNFLEVAMKYYRYGRCMSKDSNPSTALLIRKYGLSFLIGLLLASQASYAFLSPAQVRVVAIGLQV